MNEYRKPCRNAGLFCWPRIYADATDNGFVQKRLLNFNYICSMTIKELNKSKLPIVVIAPSLDKLSKKVLFKDKLDSANKTLKTVGLPQPK